MGKGQDALRQRSYVFLSILLPGQRLSPLISRDYLRIIWLIKQARTLSPQQAAMHCIWGPKNCLFLVSFLQKTLPTFFFVANPVSNARFGRLQTAITISILQVPARGCSEHGPQTFIYGGDHLPGAHSLTDCDCLTQLGTKATRVVFSSQLPPSAPVLKHGAEGAVTFLFHCLTSQGFCVVLFCSLLGERQTC